MGPPPPGSHRVRGAARHAAAGVRSRRRAHGSPAAPLGSTLARVPVQVHPRPFPSLTPSPRSLSPEPPAIAAGFELPRRPPPTLPVPPDPTTAFASPVRLSSAHSRRRSRPRPRDRLATSPDRHYRAELKLELAPPTPPPLAPLDLLHRTRLTPAHPTHPFSSPLAHATPRSPPPRRRSRRRPRRRPSSVHRRAASSAPSPTPRPTPG